MIFRRKKRKDEAEELTEEVGPTTADDTDEDDAGTEDADETGGLDLDALDAQDWRGHGPHDISEVDDELTGNEEAPKIDLGSLILTGLPGSELRLQVQEETGQIVSAMLVIETLVESDTPGQPPDAYQSALELGAYAAPRSGGLWIELRDEIAQAATESGGQAAFGEGPFGVELRRLVPVTTPDGQEGYQPSRMWVAEGPRWLLRGIVYGPAAIEDDLTSPVVTDVLNAFRQVIVRRGDEAMAPGDLLPLSMPPDAVQVS